MLISRCAWHRMYRGYVKFLGVVSWRGWSVQFTDGMCRACAHRLRADWRREPPRLQRATLRARQGERSPLRVGWPTIAIPATVALVLTAGRLHDGVPEPIVPSPAVAVAARIATADGACPPSTVMARVRQRPTAVAAPSRPAVVRAVVHEPGVIWEPRVVWERPAGDVRAPRASRAADRASAIAPDAVRRVAWTSTERPERVRPRGAPAAAPRGFVPFPPRTADAEAP